MKYFRQSTQKSTHTVLWTGVRARLESCFIEPASFFVELARLSAMNNFTIETIKSKWQSSSLSIVACHQSVCYQWHCRNPEAVIWIDRHKVLAAHVSLNIICNKDCTNRCFPTRKLCCCSSGSMRLLGTNMWGKFLTHCSTKLEYQRRRNLPRSQNFVHFTWHSRMSSNSR